MQHQKKYQEDSNSITHSPYYGCTIRVVSKANVCYEGVLDGISIDKDRIFLKNVRVNGNINDAFNRGELKQRIYFILINIKISFLNLDHGVEPFDSLNTVMIDHLTNDMHVYDHVCLNVRDMQELRLVRLPSTFHESKAKLHSIDPCLIDIRLSPTKELEKMLDKSTPISRRSRNESIGSNGDSLLITSSSNESSSSVCYQSPDASVDEQIKKFTRLSTTATNAHSKPVTLLAKKVLPKKIGRNNFRSSIQENPQTNNQNTLKKPLDNLRKTSPIRVTITSKLNPNATPFYVQKSPTLSTKSTPLTFYEQNRFQPVHSRTIPNVINTGNNPVRQQKNHHRPHQRFVPPRQMANQKNFNIQTPPPATDKYRIYSSSLSNNSSSYELIPGYFYFYFYFYFSVLFSLRIHQSNIIITIDSNGSNIINTTYTRTFISTKS
jgi:hypothetical protein